MNCVLTCCMYAAEVCWTSSLPYETECISSGSGVLPTFWIQESREYSLWYHTVRGIGSTTAPMYSMSSSDSIPALGTFLPWFLLTLTTTLHAVENFATSVSL